MPLFRSKAFLIFFISTLSLSSSLGQEISSAEMKLKCLLNSNSSYVPKDLLSTKTVVVISMDDRSGSGIRGDWKGLAEEAHFYIAKLGIDPVTYYYVDDLISGYDVKKAITEEMVGREIQNVLMLSKDRFSGRDQFIGVITEFDQKPSFISHNQNAWKSQTSDLEILFRNLARSIDNSDLVKENFLILDSPEFFRGVKMLNGRRLEAFNTDLRIDRIAIPVFEELPVPDNSGSINQNMVTAIQKDNEEILQKNAQLEQLMANYPYEYKLLPYQYDENKLFLQGCQFVLMSITSSGRNVRELLGYEVTDQVNELITMKKDDAGNIQVKAIPIDGLVTKYYIKHINSGEVFLGEQWDGDDNWLDALKNHLNLLLEKLGENKK
jgi:hypothetical protein